MPVNVMDDWMTVVIIMKMSVQVLLQWRDLSWKTYITLDHCLSKCISGSVMMFDGLFTYLKCYLLRKGQILAGSKHW